MDLPIFLLLLCNILAPTVVVIRACVSRQGIQVNHLLLFTLGFGLYWILPIVVGRSGLYRDNEGLTLWYSLFDAIPQSSLVSYLAVCLCSYLSFAFGSLLSERPFSKPISKRMSLYYDTRLFNLYLFLGIVLLGILAVPLAAKLFKGYTAYDPADLRGSFTAVSVFMSSLMIIYCVKREARRHVPLGFAKVILNRASIAYFISAVLVLSMGGRLFFLTGLVMLLVYKSVYFHRMRFSTLLFLSVVAAGSAGVAGLVRTGTLTMGLEDVIFDIACEPLYTAFSLISFLSDHSFEAIRFPWFLLSGFINLVPSVVLPLKAELIRSPDAYGYTVFAPMGALSSFFSFMINFGVLGTQIVLFLLSLGLNFLKLRSKVPLFKIMYIMSSGWLAFSFFRESFQQSIVKEIFEFSILLPTLVVLSLHLLSVAVTGRGRDAKLSEFAGVGDPKAVSKPHHEA